MTARVVAWMTGLSGSGKSTIATAVAAALSAKGYRVRILDGDDVRARHPTPLGFSPADIRVNNALIAQMCNELLPDHDVLLVPVISPFRDARAAARARVGDAFREVHVDASLDHVRRRDPKGLYRRADAGELRGMIGVAPDVPYEAPAAPDLRLDTERESVTESVVRLEEYIERQLGTAR